MTMRTAALGPPASITLEGHDPARLAGLPEDNQVVHAWDHREAPIEPTLPGPTLDLELWRWLCCRHIAECRYGQPTHLQFGFVFKPCPVLKTIIAR
jgi:hypothetical protein